MAKASLKLPNGTSVQIEGTHEEIHKLLQFYSAQEAKPGAKDSRKKKAFAKDITNKSSDAQSLRLAEIVNQVKECSEAEAIEKQILDRSGQVDRVLLPLYTIHQYMDNAFGMTSGEIRKVITDLGISIALPNVSKTLSGTASRYVIGDKIKKKGQPVRYKLSRRGVQYLKAVLEATESGE